MTFTFESLPLDNKDALRQRVLELFERDISTVPTSFTTHNYTFIFGGGNFPVLIRVGEEMPHHTAQDVLSMLMWVDDLKNDVSNVCQAIPSKGNRLVERVVIGEKAYLIVMFRKANGTLLPSHLWDKTHYYNAGALLGKIHRTSSEGYQRGFRYKRKHWDESPFYDFSHLIDYFAPSAQQNAEAVLQRIKNIPRDPRWYGMIHGDFTNANLFSDWGELWVFGFDDCCYGYFMIDIAYLAHIFMHGHKHVEANHPAAMSECMSREADILAQIRAGYSTEYTLPDEQWDLFHDFYRLRVAESLSVVTTYKIFSREVMLAGFEPSCVLLETDRNPIEKMDEVWQETVNRMPPEHMESFFKGFLA